MEARVFDYGARAMKPVITNEEKFDETFRSYVIKATVDGKVVRSWPHHNAGDYRGQMARAQEYARGWHDCADRMKTVLQAMLDVKPALRVALAALTPPRSQVETEAMAIIAKAIGPGAWDDTDHN
jgi:hypothetical protein